MSYFDDASLVMIPSGYKTSKVYSVKPTDGSGDLTFSRSNDTATRVNSAGLIEKVRTNLFTYSEQLDNAAWTKADTTIVANAIANPLNGAVTADKMTDASTSIAARYIYESPASIGTIYTSSGYFKKGEYNFVTLHAFGINGAVFNLDTGVKVSQSGGVGNITSVGNGWYRCTFTFTAGGSSVFFSQSPAGIITYAGTAGSGIYAYGLQVETGDIATDYIATTSAAVSVGPVANVPRLDYLGSSCPRLLLEPQRTNNALYSEQLDNAAWTKQNTTVSANAITSPSGYQDADKLIETSATGAHRASVLSAATLNGTFSFFAKAGERTKVAILSTTIDLGFDLSNGTLIDLGSGTSAGKIENYGNGWYRCSLPQASGIVALALALLDNSGNISYTGNGTSGAYFWGAQLEVGAYATSYIPTLGAAVTRGADAASKTGISSLIGQTEGTLFVEFDLNGNYDSNGIVAIDVLGAGNNEAYIFVTGAGQLRLELYVGGVVQGQIISSIGAVGRKKIAFAYKANDFVGYMNGVQVGTDTSGTVGAMDTIYVGTYQSPSYATGNMNQTLLFKTRLSNADLAALTTI